MGEYHDQENEEEREKSLEERIEELESEIGSLKYKVKKLEHQMDYLYRRDEETENTLRLLCGCVCSDEKPDSDALEILSFVADGRMYLAGSANVEPLANRLFRFWGTHKGGRQDE